MNPESESSGNPMGELIRRQRELAELSMRQVAAMAGISNPYLSQIEHGLRAPSEAVLETIAATLGVPPETLRPGTDDDHGPARSAAACVSRCTAASSSHRDLCRDD